MSCNGCRVLRKGCSDTCILRSSLHSIKSPEAQGNATLFLAKFFGRSDLMSLISAVPESQRPALFESLLYEACGRTVNPVNGAVGLLSTGNWHVCQAAVETVLRGGALRPIPGVRTKKYDESFTAGGSSGQVGYPFIVGGDDSSGNLDLHLEMVAGATRGGGRSWQVEKSLRSSNSSSFCSGGYEMGRLGNEKERKLLNLFV